jgi:cytochrome c biogenesis protein CcmG, thiol:disulfide interchange protein DsbE
MKAFKFFFIIGLLSIGNTIKSQNSNLPDEVIYSLDGSMISASVIGNSDGLLVVFFWSAANRTSLSQLTLLNEAYENLPERKEVKIVGICTDNTGIMQSIKPFVYGNGINYEVYIDRNNDLKRAMNLSDTPCTILFDQKKKTSSTILGYCANIAEIINDKSEFNLVSDNDDK